MIHGIRAGTAVWNHSFQHSSRYNLLIIAIFSGAKESLNFSGPSKHGLCKLYVIILQTYMWCLRMGGVWGMWKMHIALF